MIYQSTDTAERYPRTEAIARRWEEVAALPGTLTLAALETTISDLVVELLKSHLQLEGELAFITRAHDTKWQELLALRSERVAPEGYHGIAHDFETMRAALRELEQASLRMAQCWNRAGEKRGEGVSVAEVDAARQGVDVARKKALAALNGATSARVVPTAEEIFKRVCAGPQHPAPTMDHPTPRTDALDVKHTAQLDAIVKAVEGGQSDIGVLEIFEQAKDMMIAYGLLCAELERALTEKQAMLDSRMRKEMAGTTVSPTVQQAIENAVSQLAGLYGAGKHSLDHKIYREQLEKVARIAMQPEPVEPTHRHEDGGLYRLVTGSRYKTVRGEHWSDCIIYQAAEDGKLYVTTPARWTERFTPIENPSHGTHDGPEGEGL